MNKFKTVFSCVFSLALIVMFFAINICHATDKYNCSCKDLVETVKVYSINASSQADADTQCLVKCGGAPLDVIGCTKAATPSSPTTSPTVPAPKVELTDPLGIGGKQGVAAGQEVQYLIGRVIKVIMGLVGSIALLMFVYGGFLWMTAAGNDERVSKGKEILIWSVAGLAVIFSSYILVYFVLASLMGLG